MSVNSLATVARSLVAPGKGLLAADESSQTIAKRFAEVGVNSTLESRLAYRDLLMSTPGIESFLSGVILYDETIHQVAGDGRPFSQLLSQRGIIPGIKVDLGTVAMPSFPGETLTEGLDGLQKRLAGYLQLGARFAKWRAVIHIGAGLPTDANLLLNAQDLARYAACCQEVGLVPIVEPEVLMEGDHDLETCLAVTTRTLDRVFSQLREQRVALEALVLKCNMVTSGAQAPVQASIERVAAETIHALRRCVPPAVPGIAFLSGGQAPALATQHLDAINRLGPHPWSISFSYGRALQEPVLSAWAGEPGHRFEAQRQLVRRLRLNAAATRGAYLPAMEIDQISI